MSETVDTDSSADTVAVEFEFAKGEILYRRDSNHGEGMVPRPFMVQERHVVDCHGGVQKLYKLVGEGGQFPEFSLSREMPPFQPASDALLADRARVAEARRQEYDVRWESVRQEAENKVTAEDTKD